MYSAEQAAQTLMQMEWSNNWRFRERVGIHNKRKSKKSPYSIKHLLQIFPSSKIITQNIISHLKLDTFGNARL
jgi:hypothetical protein